MTADIDTDINTDINTAEPVVFVIDEDPAAAEAIRRLTGMMNLPCRVFTSGREFLDTVDRSQWGCLVTELAVADVGGLQILQRLVEEGATLPVVFVTARATVPIAVRAMRAGAFHFLEKPFHEQELWDILQDAITTDHERRSAAERQKALHERLALLTRKEEQVLGMIGEGKPNRVIAEELGLSIRTVEVRRRALMQKLGFQNPEELLGFAMSLGNGHAEPPLRERFAVRNGAAFRPWGQSNTARNMARVTV